MATRKIKFELEITIRDYTKEERDDESLERDECVGAAEETDADELAEAIAGMLETEQDELFSGSGAIVKIKSVKCTATSSPTNSSIPPQQRRATCGR